MAKRRGLLCRKCGADQWYVACDEAETRQCIPCRRRYRAEVRLRDPANRMYWQARSRAMKEGIPFAIKRTDIRVPKYCPVFGVPLVVAQGSHGGPDSPSLDRFIPELGYVPDNIRVISWRANDLKRNASYAEIRRLADWMKAETSGRV